MTNFEADQSANSKLFSFYQNALAFCNDLATVFIQHKLILRKWSTNISQPEHQMVPRHSA